MTLYLWHLTVMVLVIGLAHLLGDVGLHLRPGTWSFWATRPMWIAIYASGLAIFVPVFGRFEQTARMDCRGLGSRVARHRGRRRSLRRGGDAGRWVVSEWKERSGFGSSPSLWCSAEPR